MRLRRLAGAIGLLTLVGAGSASASLLPPMRPSPLGDRRIEGAALVCGPFRCAERPFWRYGSGTGFRPLQRFGFIPPRRSGYPPFPFGRFGGFGPGRRW